MKNLLQFIVITFLLCYTNTAIHSQNTQEILFNNNDHSLKNDHQLDQNFFSVDLREKELKIAAKNDVWRDNDWYTKDSFKYEYDKKGNILDSKWLKLQGDKLLKYRQTKFTYNKINQIITNKTQYWKDNQWVDDRLITYTYNSIGLGIIQNNQKYRDNKWILWSKTIFEYYSTNLIKSWLTQYRNDSNWVNNSITELEYNSQGKRIKQVGKSWRNNEWVISRYWTYEYNSKHIFRSHKVDPVKGIVYDYQWITSYNSDRKPVEKIIQNWKNDKWVNDKLIETNYLSNNSTEKATQLWVNNKWGAVITINYNKYNDQDYLVFWRSTKLIDGVLKNLNQSIIERNTSNNIIHRLRQEWLNGEWINQMQNHYYYNSINSSTNLINEDVHLTVFPNPSVGHINLLADQFHGPSHLEVFDASGRNVHSKDIPNSVLNHSLNLSHLTNGTYYIQLNNGAYSSTQKIIICK